MYHTFDLRLATFISNKPDMNNIAFVFVHHIEIDSSVLKVLEQLYSVSLEV